jgi:2-polyprenyl-6-methoxyphenol hydroxylase-like FAD-dependent oxidoreductase
MFLGVLDDFIKIGGPPPIVRSYDKDGNATREKPMMEHCEPSPDMPIVRRPNYLLQIQLISLPQSNNLTLGKDASCAILRKRLLELGVTVEYGVELTTFTQDDAGTRITLKHAAAKTEETVNAKFLVAADGARGPIRKLVQVPFLGESNPEISMVVGELALSNLDKIVGAPIDARE